VSTGELQDAEYLPLNGTMVAETYLVKGRWTENWTFQACERQVIVKLDFTADGWGGSTVDVSHRKTD
jgi:hypothetical protein